MNDTSEPTEDAAIEGALDTFDGSAEEPAPSHASLDALLNQFDDAASETDSAEDAPPENADELQELLWEMRRQGVDREIDKAAQQLSEMSSLSLDGAEAVIRSKLHTDDAFATAFDTSRANPQAFRHSLGRLASEATRGADGLVPAPDVTEAMEAVRAAARVGTTDISVGEKSENDKAREAMKDDVYNQLQR